MSWESVPLRKLIKPNNKRNRPDLPLLSVVRDKGIIKRKLDKSDNHNIIPEDLSNYKVVSEGQFVINKMKAWQGSCGVSPYNGIVSPAYFVFDLIIDNPRFFNYSIRSRSFIDEFNRISKGIRVDQWDLDFYFLKYVRFPLPPPDEQDQIVRYLDWKVSGINRLINAKRRQIELLQEQKQAVINEAVSKGGDGWLNGRVGRFYDVILGKMIQPNSKAESDVYKSYMCAANIKWSGIKLEPLKQMWFSDNEVKKYLLKAGDLLVTEGGDVGVSCIWQGELEECYVQNSVHIVRSNQNDIKYLYYWLFNLKNTGWIDNICNKATIAHFTKEKLENTPLSLPPFTEQQTIVKYLDEQCGRIDKILSKLDEEITLFAEYRTRLISDVVTGKVDVRGVVVPEYEAVEDVEEDGEMEDMED